MTKIESDVANGKSAPVRIVLSPRPHFIVIGQYSVDGEWFSGSQVYRSRAEAEAWVLSGYGRGFGYESVRIVEVSLPARVVVEDRT